MNEAWSWKIMLPLLAVLLLAGCGENIKSGTVVAKGHEDARTYVAVLPVFVGETCMLTEVSLPSLHPL